MIYASIRFCKSVSLLWSVLFVSPVAVSSSVDSMKMVMNLFVMFFPFLVVSLWNNSFILICKQTLQRLACINTNRHEFFVEPAPVYICLLFFSIILLSGQLHTGLCRGALLVRIKLSTISIQLLE